MVMPICNVLWVASGLLLVLVGCATSRESEEKVVLTPTYTLSASKAISHKKPLPNESTILVHWKLGDLEKTVDGFRAWDFNHDGKFEMLEILSEEGRITGRAYDFDGDGRIDLRQAANKEVLEKADARETAQIQINQQPTPSLEEAFELLKIAH